MNPTTIPASCLTALLVLAASPPASASEPESEHSAQPDHDTGSEHDAKSDHDAKPEHDAKPDHGAKTDHDGDHHGDAHHGDAHRFFIGAKGSYLLSFPHGEIHHLGGGGLFFEMVLVPSWLEIEFSVKGMTSGHGAVLPIDVLLKIPFHVNKVFHPFVGLGPTVIPSFQDENEVFFGGVAEVGSYFWVSRSWALLASLGYGLIYEHGLVNEAGVNVGVVYGW